MKYRTFGVCIVLACAVGQAGAASASAAESTLPELGRCVKEESHHGAFKYANCVAQSPGGTGAYAWQPGPGTNAKFAGTAATVILETVGRSQIACSASELEGEYTGAKTATASLSLSACERVPGGQRCQTTPAEAGTVLIPSISMELGFISGKETSKPIIGWDLSVPADAFTCGEALEATTETLEGSAIGRVKPLDKMIPEFNLRLTASAGAQIPESFEEGAKDTLTLTTLAGLEKTSEQAGLTVIGFQERPKSLFVEDGEEEKMEIKAKV